MNTDDSTEPQSPPPPPTNPAPDPSASSGGAPAAKPFWLTDVDEGQYRSYPVDDIAVWKATFEIPNGREESGPVLLARIKGGPRGYTPQFGDVEEVFGISLSLYSLNFKSEWPTPEAVESAVPFQGYAYTKRRHTPENAQIAVVLPFSRSHTLEEFHRIKSYLEEKLWAGMCIEVCDVLTPVVPPTSFNAGCEDFPCSDWHRVLNPTGPALDVGCVPAAFVPATPFTVPPKTEAKKRALVRAEAQHAAAQLGVVLALFKSSELISWMIKKNDPPNRLLLAFAKAICSNLVPLIHEVDPAGHAAHGTALNEVDQFVRSFFNTIPLDKKKRNARGTEVVQFFDDWNEMVDEHLEEMLENPWVSPAAWPELRQAGAPVHIGGFTPSPLGDVLREVGVGALDPRRWVYVAKASKWHLRDDRGELLEDGISVDAAKVMLEKWLDKTLSTDILKRAERVVHRTAVFSTPAEITTVNGVRVWNMYRPTTLVPKRGAYPSIEGMLRNLVGPEKTDEAVEYVKDWVAKIVQELQQGRLHKWLTFLLFSGPPGSGKTFFTRIFREMVGPANVVIPDQKRMESSFFPVMPNTVLIVGNEIHAADRSDEDLADHIKRIVTDGTLMLERKYEAAGEVPNNVNLVITTNNDRPVRLDPNDRRASVFRSEQMLDEKFAAPLDADLKGARAEVSAFFYDLLRCNVKIGVNELFHTKARQDLIGMGLSKVDAFAHRLAKEGFLALFEPYRMKSTATVEATFQATDEQGNLIEHLSSDTLLDVARFHCPAPRGADVSRKSLSNAIRKVLPGASNELRVRRKPTDNPDTVWTGVPLVVAGKDSAGQPILGRKSGDIIKHGAP